MPGSRRNPAAAGCNALIADGAHPLLDPGDLLVALGRGGSLPGRWSSDQAGKPSDRDEAAVLHALGGDPATIDDLERNAASGPGPPRGGPEPPGAGRAGAAPAGPVVADVIDLHRPVPSASGQNCRPFQVWS